MNSNDAPIKIPLASFRSDPITCLTDLANRDDVVRFNMAGRMFVLVNDPELIGQVLLVDQDKFGRGPGLLRTRAVLGDGLLTNDSANHPERRRALQPSFTRDAIASYHDTMAEEASRSVTAWTPGRIDLHHEMTRMTMRIVARSLFDIAVVDAGAAETISNAVSDAIRALYDRLAPIGGTRINRKATLRTAVQSLDSAITKIFGEGLSPGQARDEIVTFFLAGHESVTNALSWTGYLLANNPNAQEAAASTPEYRQAVMKESLRIYPPAWMMSRRAKEPFELRGLEYPAETIVIAAQCVTHHDQRYFADPQRFLPERWLSTEPEQRFSYFPFGLGRRACIGERFAMAEMDVILETILTHWRIAPEPDIVVEALPAITLRPRNGLPIIISSRVPCP